MGWQRRSSAHAYNSMSGYSFAIGQYTGRILDCIVYSTACKQREINGENKEHTVRDDDTFWNSSTTKTNHLP